MHHQMMHPEGTDHTIVGWSKHILGEYHYDVDKIINVVKEPEFVHFHKVKGYAVQWHPEMMAEDNEGTEYILNYIQESLCPSKLSPAEPSLETVAP